jgi:uncharacterized protein (DUF302 family)
VNTGAKHKMASRWRPMAKRLAKGLGVLLIGGAVATAGLHQVPNLMFNESQSRYGFDRTVAELTTAANQAGWKIPSVHDLQKPAKTPRPIKVLELCQQDHAHNILERAEKTDTTKLSAMMPCRISVYQKPDGQVYVSRLNGSLLSRFMPKEVGSVMRTAALENEAILSNVVK